MAAPPYDVGDIVVYVMVSAAVVGVVFRIFRVQNRLWAYTSLKDLSVIAVAAGCSVLLITLLLMFFLRDVAISLEMPVLHFFFLLFPMVASRVLVRSLRDFKYFAPEQDKRLGGAGPADAVPDHVILVGANGLAELYLRAVSELAQESVEVVGIVDEDPSKHRQQIRSQEILGGPEDISSIIHEFHVRGIAIKRLVICNNWSALSQAARDSLQAHEKSSGLKCVFLNEFFDLIQTRQNGSAYNGEPANHSEVPGQGRIAAPAGPDQIGLSGYFKVKRGLDFVLALGLAIILSPVILLVALTVAANLGVPCLFWQKRPGYRGRVFKIYKFRTMRSPSDADGNRIPDEHRQTVVSRLLRRLRLDELPQLYNVLKGDMALIGPRPLLPVDQPQLAALRQHIRPGVSDWAQVNGGQLLGAEEKLALDLWYARHASFWLDMKIILLSLTMVIRGEREDPAAIEQAVAELNAERAAAGVEHREKEKDDADLPKVRDMRADPVPAANG
ncbi:MAG: sugar transferase [Methyloligellaceae bacterium]